jgi:predicted RNase H-like nuclease (RuvC/YqgF family)
MDNRVNKIRKKISALRLEMREAERAMRQDVARNLDCTGAATRLMALRAELAGLGRRAENLGRHGTDRHA